MSRLLIEFPADDLDRARRFWQDMLDIALAEREPEEGEGLLAERAGAACQQCVSKIRRNASIVGQAHRAALA